jgi:DNA or RNA helicases of superfamily II
MTAKGLREELLLLKKEGKPFVLLTTGSYAGEGFDLPALDTLILAMPISSHNNLKQYLGRLLRNLDSKDELRVYDYVDYAIPMIYKMYQKRLQTYNKLGYQVWDNEQSELYKSNLFNIDYQNHLARDLTNAKENIILTFPFLNKESYQFLVSLNLQNKSQNKCIFLPPIHVVSSNYQKNYRYYIEELKKLTYQIIFKEEINQKFVIIDNNLIWSLPQKYQSEEGIALRIYSKEMANRLLSFFNDGSNS